MFTLVGLLLFAVAAAFLYALCAIQDHIAERLNVEVDMAKTVGDTITVTVTAIPAGAPLTNVVVNADPALFAPTADPVVFTTLAVVTGATVSATAQAADGSTVSGTSAPFDVSAPVVIATGLDVAVA